MTLLNAANIKPLETFTALEVLATQGYDPTKPKVKRAAEYLELWRQKTVEVAKATPAPVDKVGGEAAEQRLMDAVLRESQFYLRQPMHAGQHKPTPIQVAIVLHALADHTAIMSMLQHRPDPTSPWPHATSVGRWFHDVGHKLEDMK